MNLQNFSEKISKKEISIPEHTRSILKEVKMLNERYSYFLNISEDLALDQAKNAKGKLAGLPISVKDCLCVKGVESTSGSRVLKSYKPLFTATSVQRLVNEGAIIIGKTNQDEFGFGSFNINVGLGNPIPKNPFDEERVTGGSSGGGAGFAQKTTHAHIAVVESTGGSIVAPASFCGVYGLCPTYGAVSRYGLMDYANSLDKIGLIGKDCASLKKVFDVMKGHDPKDCTSISFDESSSEIKKVGLIKESLNVDPLVKEMFLRKLESLGYEVKEVSMPLTMKHGIGVYYIIAMAEASTNLAKYCGIRYGLQEELDDNFNAYFSRVRDDGFGKEAKRRILIGTFVRMAGYRDQYYLKAMKVRTLIIDEYKRLFKKFDVLVSPTMPLLPPKFSEVESLTPLQNYMIDQLTVGPNLAGLPHLNIPAGFVKNLPVGLLAIADHFNEAKLFNFDR
ncbi:MAG: amidase family protein [Nanoarchaeota archaeon]